jgi:YVTN family beta-propeller protein
MQYRILGPLAVAKDGSEVVMGSGKQRALLVLLLLHANEAVSTDRLIDQLWGESRSSSATKVLQNYVSKLRRLLGDDVLITRARGYELRVEPGELDLDRFDDLVADGRRALAAGDPEQATAVLAEALALWRGPPLADFAYEAFASAEIDRLDGLRLAALSERIEADLRLGRHDALIGELETLVARYPLQERLRGQLMLALYRSGRQAEALQAYQATRRVLVDELGIEPSQELQRLEHAILVHDPSLEPPPVATSAVARKRSRTRFLVVTLVLAAVIAVAGILVIHLRGGKGIAASPNGAVGAIDPKTNTLVGKVPVRNLPTRIAAGMGQVWALSSYGGTMSEIDPRSLMVASTIAVSASSRALPPSLEPAVPPLLDSVAFGSGQGWVTYNGTLVEIRRSGGLIPITFARNGYDDVSDVAADGRSIWIGSQRQHAVIKFDPAVLHVVATVHIPAVPLAVAAAGDGVWVAGFTTSSRTGVLMRIDPTQDTVSATIPLPGIPGDVATGFGGVWVTVNSRNAVWRIDPKTRSVLQTITVGSGPVAVTVGEGAVWVANTKDGTVSRIDPATNKVVATIPVGGSPRDVAVGSGRIWVAAP